MIKLFYSYSHLDEEYREQLEKHLSILKRNSMIEDWHDRQIVAGEKWDDKIDTKLEEAEVILLLISSDFIASNYCYEIEMRNAIKKHDSGNAVVIPIILRPCLWKDTPFAKFQALPKDAKPISKWNNHDDAWLNVAEGIKTVCEKFNKKPDSTKPPKQNVNEDTIEYIIELNVKDKINLTNQELYDFGKNSILKFRGIRDFDRVFHWPNIILYGSSEIIKNGIKYKGGASPFSNQHFDYELDLYKDGSIKYYEKLKWNGVENLLLDLEKFSERLISFLLFASNWLNFIGKNNTLRHSKIIKTITNLPKRTILHAPIDLLNSDLKAPQYSGEGEIISSFEYKLLEHLELEAILRICNHLLAPICSEFNYNYENQIKFPRINNEALEYRVEHLLRAIDK